MHEDVIVIYGVIIAQRCTFHEQIYGTSTFVIKPKPLLIATNTLERSILNYMAITLYIYSINFKKLIFIMTLSNCVMTLITYIIYV